MFVFFLSEVGGVSTKWPQPGNRFVSFVRASGRAGAREISRYLEGFARWRCSPAPPARPLCFQNGSVFVRVFCKTVLFYTRAENVSHKSSMFSIFLKMKNKMHFFL